MTIIKRLGKLVGALILGSAVLIGAAYIYDKISPPWPICASIGGGCR